MSTARTIATPERRIYLSEAIAEQIRASELPFEPRQFEFWFAYKSGRNIALNAAADAITVQNGALTGPDIERLHDAYLSPWRMGDDADAIAASSSRAQAGEVSARFAKAWSRGHTTTAAR